VELRPIAVVDIDGVVADVRHRLHHLQRRPKDWEGFFRAADRDPPHLVGIELVHELALDHDVVFLTGRPARLEAPTRRWLASNGIGDHPLVMRDQGDRRPAAVVKVELLRELARHRPIGIVVDDDPAVIDAVREAGFPVRLADWEERDADEERELRRAQERDGRT
jgi:hypothetical protein